MNYGVYSKTTGTVLRVGSSDDRPTIYLQAQAEEAVYVGDVTLEDKIDLVTKTRIIGGNPARPPMPSPAHRLTPDGRAWVLDYVSLRAVKADSIKAERDRRTLAPIAHDGRRIDADVASQLAITQKLEELADNLPNYTYPGLLQWRDSDNGMITFGSTRELKLWLQGLLQAISRRRTEVYVWSWEKKAELAGVSDDRLGDFTP